MENAKVPVPWNKTPLIFSDGLSEKLGCDVYLKLEVRTLASPASNEEAHARHLAPSPILQLQTAN